MSAVSAAEKVDEIAEKYMGDEMVTLRQLAAEYRTHEVAIADILRGKLGQKYTEAAAKRKRRGCPSAAAKRRTANSKPVNGTHWLVVSPWGPLFEAPEC